jgi:carbonic anhydrase/acetyltransferase-like protein (isoleucine patch superfamily)
LIGMRAVVLNGCSVGRYAIVAAGAVLRPGFEVPDGTLVAGVPAKVVREVTDEERAMIDRTAASYRRKAQSCTARALPEPPVRLGATE